MRKVTAFAAMMVFAIVTVAIVVALPPGSTWYAIAPAIGAIFGVYTLSQLEKRSGDDD